MEVSLVRNRLRLALDAARERARLRRERVAGAEGTFEAFLTLATPVAKQLANALKVEGYAFTPFTPGRSLRLALDRSRDDFVEISLDATGDPPEVMGRVSHTRGSRTVDEERPLKPGASPAEITEDDVLEFFLDALTPWLER